MIATAVQGWPAPHRGLRRCLCCHRSHGRQRPLWCLTGTLLLLCFCCIEKGAETSDDLLLRTPPEPLLLLLSPALLPTAAATTAAFCGCSCCCGGGFWKTMLLKSITMTDSCLPWEMVRLHFSPLCWCVCSWRVESAPS